MSDQYLYAILEREAVDTSAHSAVLKVAYGLLPIIRRWGNEYLANVSPSGSFAKGTANAAGPTLISSCR